jgi:hypothetical protein
MASELEGREKEPSENREAREHSAQGLLESFKKKKWITPTVRVESFSDTRAAPKSFPGADGTLGSTT